MSPSLTHGQEAVIKAFGQIGSIDDTGLAVYIHHVADISMSSSGVRSRRAELVRKGLVTVTGVKTTKSGRAQAIHGLTIKGQRAYRKLTAPVAQQARKAVAA
jgi:predicted ArsR family transcriptional regulator